MSRSLPTKALCLFLTLLSACLFTQGREANAEESKSYSLKELGINLKKHPDTPSFDFSAPTKNEETEPVILQGAVETHIESVEMEGHGPYTVEVASGLNLVDRKRKKLIKLEICYPKEAGLYPVLIYSHAPIASARDYRPLSAFYASHGFISIMPTHEDALILHMKSSNPVDEKVSVFKLLKLARTNSKELAGRKDDIARVLDGIALLPTKVGSLADKVDQTKVAVVGHHAGAYSCELLSGVDLKDKRLRSGQDPRISAQLLFTGLNKALPPIGKQDWSRVKVPTMVVSFFDGVRSVDKQRKQTLQVLSQAKSADRYLLTIDSARRKKPSRRRVRKMLRNSNIELISFRPLNLFKKRRAHRREKVLATESPEKMQLNLDAPDYEEMPGSQLMNVLGISPLEKHSDERERFEFAMAATLPFLNAYLKGSQTDLESLQTASEKSYGNQIKVKMKPVN